MKRNYVALLLGLALTVSSMGVYASEGTTEAATETTTEATTEAATAEASKDENADTEAIVGQVTKVSADSITITKGVLAADDEETEADTEKMCRNCVQIQINLCLFSLFFLKFN